MLLPDGSQSPTERSCRNHLRYWVFRLELETWSEAVPLVIQWRTALYFRASSFPVGHSNACECLPTGTQTPTLYSTRVIIELLCHSVSYSRSCYLRFLSDCCQRAATGHHRRDRQHLLGYFCHNPWLPMGCRIQSADSWDVDHLGGTAAIEPDKRNHKTRNEDPV